MKKLLSAIMTLFILISAAVCYAGDVPESLLHDDGNKTFIGEVKELTPDTVTVIHKYNIKGDFEENKEYTYKDSEDKRPEYVKAGEEILCCYFDEDNVYTYEIESYKDGKIELTARDDMAQRLQDYINDGSFAKAEEERVKNALPTVSPDALTEEDVSQTAAPRMTPRPTATPRATAAPRVSAAPKAVADSSVLKSTTAPKADATTAPKANPKTGDAAPLAELALMCILAIAAIAAVQIKKNRN